MDQSTRLDRAVYQLVTSPGGQFFGTLAMHLKQVERRDIETAATDGVHLFYNPEYLATLTDAKLRGLAVHEVWHCAADHMGRLGARDLPTFNEAADYELNQELVAAGFELPDGALLDAKWNGQTAESIYGELIREASQKQQQKQQGQNGSGSGNGSGNGSQGQAGSGSQQGQNGSGAASPSSGAGKAANGQAGAGGQNGSGAPSTGTGSDPKAAGSMPGGAGGGSGGNDPGKCGGFLPAPQGMGAELTQKWEARVIQAAAICEKAGKLPGNVKRMIQEARKPRVDWREALRRFVSNSMSRDYSWQKPNRRYFGGGLYAPALVSNGREHGILGIDSSGSVNDAALGAIREAVQDMLDSRLFDRVTVFYCDTEITGVEEFESGDLIRLDAKGGGGTRFAPAMDWIREHGHGAACAIYFTDLCVSERHIGRDPGLPLIWANWHRPRAMPFGEVLQIDPHA
jgi:predicted metal-dependent peptidase